MTKKEFENWSFEVTWKVDDGYVNNRPHTTKIKPYNDMSFEDWNKINTEEQMIYIEECVQQDFENIVSFTIENYGDF